MELHVPERRAGQRLGGRLDAQHLLDRTSQQRRIFNQLGSLVDPDEWIGKNKGRKVYFLLEHTRLDRLKTLLGSRKLETLTTKRDCNKFLLARTLL